ncbi:Zn-dependent hydrolase, partial [Micromonospora sp. KC721]
MRAPADGQPGSAISGRLWRLAGLAAVAGLAYAARDVPAQLGGRLTGARAERAARSPQFRDGHFHNRAQIQSMITGEPGRNLLWELVFGKQRRRPTAPV